MGTITTYITYETVRFIIIIIIIIIIKTVFFFIFKNKIFFSFRKKKKKKKKQNLATREPNPIFQFKMHCFFNLSFKTNSNTRSSLPQLKFHQNLFPLTHVLLSFLCCDIVLLNF